MKRSLLIAYALSVLLFFTSCSATNQHTTSLSDYELWNKTTNNLISLEFNGSLPDKNVVDKYGREYYYSFSQETFGDPNFVIYIELAFPNETIYNKEKQKIASLSPDNCDQGNPSCYAIQCNSEMILEYLNDKIYDGMFYNFEFAFADDDSYTICFLNARVWDYHKDQKLLDTLKNFSEYQG